MEVPVEQATQAATTPPRVLAARYQLHLAKPLHPRQLVEAIASFGEEMRA